VNRALTCPWRIVISPSQMACNIVTSLFFRLLISKVLLVLTRHRTHCVTGVKAMLLLKVPIRFQPITHHLGQFSLSWLSKRLINCAYRKLRLAQHSSNATHCYIPSLYVIHFKCALNYGEAQGPPNYFMLDNRQERCTFRYSGIDCRSAES
jgi:hypothetical protein